MHFPFPSPASQNVKSGLEPGCLMEVDAYVKIVCGIEKFWPFVPVEGKPLVQFFMN